MLQGLKKTRKPGEEIVFGGKKIFLDKLNLKKFRISKGKIDHQVVRNHRTVEAVRDLSGGEIKSLL